MATRNNHFIYLVDDDDSFRESLSLAFDSLGYNVHTFSSAESLLEYKDLSWPAVIISDVRMPGQSGVELQKRLIDEGFGLPIIFISAESTLSEAVIGMKQGAIDFMQKPFSMEALIRAIEAAFEKQKANLLKTHKTIIRDQKLARLAPRERVVCGLMAKGYGNPKMASELNLSIETIKQYKKNVYEKLAVDDLAELISLMRD